MEMTTKESYILLQDSLKQCAMLEAILISTVYCKATPRYTYIIDCNKNLPTYKHKQSTETVHLITTMAGDSMITSREGAIEFNCLQPSWASHGYWLRFDTFRYISSNTYRLETEEQVL